MIKKYDQYNKINIQLIFILLLLFVPVALWFAYDKNREINEKDAIEAAMAFADSVSAYRTFYSKTIVKKLRSSKDIAVIHNYNEKDNAIPLPATFAKDFGKFYSKKTGRKVNLYSDLPFPWREKDHSLDDFETKALGHLKRDPSQPVWRFEQTEKGRVLRYAKADVLGASCVACHNSYPGTPKTDWKVGDIRGVLSVSVPAFSNSSVIWIKQFGIFLGLIALAALLLVVTLRNLKKSLRRERNALLESQDAHIDLETNLAKGRSVFNSMEDALVVIDEQGIISETNDAILDLLGYKPEELVGQNVKMIVDPIHKPNHDQYLQDYYDTGEKKVLGVLRHVNARRKDGALVPIELSVNEAKTPEGRMFTGILHDITERVDTEKKLAEAHEEALESARVKSQFLANMSHEIRTPMNGIIGMAQLMTETKMTEEQTLLMSTINASTNSLLRIVNDVLDFSKMESGTYKIENKWFDLVNLIEEVVNLSSEQAFEKKIALSFLTDGNIPLRVNGDRDRIRQVLINLIHNAIKFTDEGYVLVSVRADLSSGKNAVLKIAVEDSGIGIPKSEMSKLFDSFSQVDGTRTRKHDGSGLGLAISKSLTQLMGGDLTATSKEGKGSEFVAHFSLLFREVLVLPKVIGEEYALLFTQDNHLAKLYMNQMGALGVKVSGLVSSVDSLWQVLSEQPKISFLVIDVDYLFQQGISESDFIALSNRLVATKKYKVILYADYRKMSNLGKQVEKDSKLIFVGSPVMPSQILSSLAMLGMIEGIQEEDNVGLKSASTKSLINKESGALLIVEDNKINSLVVTKMLNKCGYTNIKVVENGALAVEALEKKAFDLVFMDCQMPVMDGFEATKKVREMDHVQGKHTTIIALTANALESDKETCLAAGMDDYLAKPIDFNALKRMLKNWLG